MPPRAPPPPIAPNNASTPYSLTLLSEYAHTLDSLPLDLSRNFADLRELDAVLSSSMASVNSKIYRLIDMLETRSASTEERLWLLGEIAEEAGRVKLGGEDKIRVACQAADSLRSHYGHLTTLLTHLPTFEPSLLVRKTTYPHVAPRSFLLPLTSDTGRRRRVANSGGLLLGSSEASPNKRRRVVQEEDVEYGIGKTPRRDRAGDIGGVQSRPVRGGQRTKKTDRAHSPAESLLSVTSHIPGQATSAPSNSRNNSNSIQRSTNVTSAAANKRRPGVQSNANGANDTSSLLDNVLYRKEHQDMAPSSSTSHPSLPHLDNPAYANNHDRVGNASQSAGQQDGALVKGAGERAGGAPPTHLEGPGMPPPRGSTQSSLTTTVASALEGSPASATVGTESAAGTGAGNDVQDGDGDGEGEDGQTYCFCNNVSYGQMIACDDKNCEIEWFHSGCVGLSVAPAGEWFCEPCRSKRANRRSSRGGKKRAGGRAGGRTAAGGV